MPKATKAVKEHLTLMLVNAIIAEIAAIPPVDYSGDYKVALEQNDILENAMWDKIFALDKSLAPALCVGRLVQLSVGDGSASYLITGIMRNQCTVAHITLGDAYASPVVQGGKMPKAYAQVGINNPQNSHLT